MIRYLTLIVLHLSIVVQVSGQSSFTYSSTYSLNDVINLAQDQSPDALARKTEQQNSLWAYQSFRAQFLPQLSLSADAPGFNRNRQFITQPDGSNLARSVFLSSSQLALSISQLIPETGGNISVRTNLFNSVDYTNNLTNYIYNPIEIALSQPISQFNQYPWSKKLEKMRLTEAGKRYPYELEEISIKSTQLFFDLIIAQITKEISQLNLLNNDTIRKIANGRYEIGKIAENEYLQTEIQYLNSKQEYEQALLREKNSTLALKNHLGIKNRDKINLVLPADIPSFEIDNELALEKARIHRPEMLAYQRELLNAEVKVKEARQNAGINASLNVTYGLASNADRFGALDDNFGENQALGIQLTIPILDWGKAKVNQKIALSNQTLIQYDIDQRMVNFEQQIFTHINYFVQTKNQIEIAKKTDYIAQRRYEISKKRYVLGKISITEMNLATKDKDESRKNYISILKDYWLAYYRLRMLTLYDFATGTDLATQ